MTFDHDFDYSFTKSIAKIVIKSHAFMIDHRIYHILAGGSRLFKYKSTQKMKKIILKVKVENSLTTLLGFRYQGDLFRNCALKVKQGIIGLLCILVPESFFLYLVPYLHHFSVKCTFLVLLWLISISNIHSASPNSVPNLYFFGANKVQIKCIFKLGYQIYCRNCAI